MDLTATAGNAQVTLAWTAPSADDNVRSYGYRQSSDSGSNWAAWTTFVPTTNNYVVSELSNGTTYSFQVRANNIVGEGPDGETVTATPAGPPAAPDLRATPGDVSMRLYWANLNDATITKFQYRKGITPENPEVAVVWDPDWEDITGSSATTVDHAVTGLTNGTEYTFEVRAVNDGGDGAAATVNATPTDAASTPSQMLNLQATVTGVSGGSGGTVTFTWDDPEEDFIDKEQYRYDGSSHNPDNWDVDWTDLPGEGTFLDFTIWEVGLHGSSAILFYELRAVNNDADDSSTNDVNEGAGPATAITVSRSNTPGESTEPPAAPGDLTATPGVEQVTLSWTASTTPSGTTITKYEYRQSSSQDSEGNAIWNPDWTAISGSGATTTEHTVSSLTDGTTYTFEVRAFHDNKTADDSDPDNGDETEDDVAGAAAQAEDVTPGAPNAPATLSASADADEQITLTWTAGDAIPGVTVTGFEYRQQASGEADWGEWTEITDSDATTTTHSVVGLEIGTGYEFQVRAVSVSGGSQPSDTASETTIGPPAPRKPTGLTATAGDDSVTLKWDNPDDLTIDKFRYQQTETVSGGTPDFSASPWLLIKDSGSDTIEHKVPDLMVGNLYYFQIQSGSAYGDSETSDYVSARPLPVRGEWSFEASIKPNPLSSGETAAVTFTATYNVKSGDATALAFDITDSDGGDTQSIDVQLSDGDNGRVGLDDSFVTNKGVIPRDANDNIICDRRIDAAKGEIVCSFSRLVEVFSKTDATPGRYGVTLNLGNGFTFEAKATTSDHAEFLSAAASADEMGEIALELEVIAGVPDAPEALTATPGNSRVTLAWDDPENPNVTGYDYQQTTTQPGITLRWTGSTDSDVAAYQYRRTTTEPGIVISWDWESGKDGYQYRRTTTEPGIFLTWEGSTDAVVTRYQYRYTNATTTDSGGNTVGDFSSIRTTTVIPDSGLGGVNRSSYKVTGLFLDKTYYFQVQELKVGGGEFVPLTGQTVKGFPSPDGGWQDISGYSVDSSSSTASFKITGSNLYVKNYFEVRAVADGAPEAAVTRTQTDVNLDGVTWTDIPDSGLGEAHRSSYKVTATDITGLDLRIPNYFEVRVGTVVVTDTIDPGEADSVTLTWENPGDSTITKWQYRRSADGTFPDAETGWEDVSSSGATTISVTISPTDPSPVDLTTANFYEVRPFTTEGQDPVTFDADVALSWTDPSESTIEKYQYRDSTDGGNTWSAWTDIPSSDASTTGYTVEDVDLSASHSFEVRGVKAEEGDPVTVSLRESDISNFQDATAWETIPNSAPGEANALSYDVTGLDNGVPYYFRIRAETDGGEAPVSNTASASTVLGAPAKPTGFTATPSDTVTEVELSWTAVATATGGWDYRKTTASAALLAWTQVADITITGWEYRHSKDGGTTWNPDWGTPITPTLDSTDATKYTAIVAGIDPDDLNLFEVRPTRDGGDQPKVTLDRQPIIGDFTGLGWTPIDGSSEATTKHKVSGLDLIKNTYYFEVRPVTATNDGAVVTSNVTHVGSIDLTWDDPMDGTITKYQYHLKEGGTTIADWLEIPQSAPQGANANSYTIPNLKSLEEDYLDPSGLVPLNDFVYTVKVRAANNSGDMGAEAAGPESDEVKANPGMPLDAPSNPEASYDLATNTFTISWDAHEIVRAEFEVSGTGPGGALPTVTSKATTSGEETTAATSADIQTDLFGEFTFEVRAREAFGPWSETVTVDRTTSPFAEASLTREVGDTVAAGANVGTPVTVLEEVVTRGFDVSYSLTEGSSPIFSINRDTGQITLAIGGPAADEYPIVVEASLSKGGARSQSSIEVTVTVTSSGTWEELGKLTPIGTAEDKAGNAVAVDEGTRVIVVGAKDAGRVYVYESLHDFTPAILEPSDNPTEFGVTVAVDGDTVVVGSKSSKVYVFTKPDTGWPDPETGTASNETAVLTASDPSSGDWFGEAVAVSGDTIVVGAASWDETNGGTTLNNIGGAYVFVKPNGGWVTVTETATLQGPTTNTEVTLNRAANDYFGRSVAIDGDNAAVGAPGKETAYLFTKPVGGWASATQPVEPAATLNKEGTEDGDGFGWSVDIDGGTIVVGEHQASTGPGAAYVFTGSGSSWAQRTKLSGLGADLGVEFGYSVAVSGDYIAVARRSQPDNDNAGSVEVFQKSETAATPYVLLASDGGADDRFGQAFTDNAGIYDGRPIAMDGDLLVVGATGDDERGNNMGAAYLFSPVTRPNVSGGVYELGSAYTDTTVTSRDGDTRVTIPSGAVPTATRYFQQVTRFSGCSGITGRTVHDCISVQLYDLDGTLIGFSEGVRLKDGTEVTLSNPRTGGAIRVSKLGGSSRTWRTILPCSNGDDPRECYTIVDDSIVVTGITSFSQYAVTTASDVTPPQRPPVRRPSGRGGGSATAHVPPTFDEGASTTRQIAENSPTGTRIGGPLVARDPLERRVLYTKGGPDADLFDVASQTGQIYVRRGTVLDYESGRKTFLIDVVGNTGVGGPAKIAVTIIVTNVPEPGSVVLSPDTPPEVGAEITAALSDPDGGINRVSWQWQRSSDGRTWNDIPGATSSSYTPTGADRGMMLRVSVRYNDAAAAGISLASMATGAVPERTPVLDLPGSVTLSPEGAPEVGTAITATLTDPDGGVAGETWQWQRSADGVTWTAIDGASTASYTPVESDVGMMLRANVSYSDAVAAGVSLVGATTEAVAAMPAPDRPGSVTLSPEGTPEVGKAITATVTDPDGEVTGEIWQWQRSADGVTWTDIDGATTERYTPTEADAGRVLRANVSYNDAVATGVNAMGMNTEAVAASPAPDLETPTPTPTPPSPPVRPATPTPTPTPTLVVPPQTSTPTQTMLPTPPPTDVPPTPTAITSEVTPTEAPTTPVTPEEEGGFPAWLIIVIIIGAVIIIAGIIIIVRSRMQQ